MFFISFIEISQDFTCFYSQSLLNLFKMNPNNVWLRPLEALSSEKIICDSYEIRNTKL